MRPALAILPIRRSSALGRMAERLSHPLLGGRRVPQKCIWEITRQCNLRCVHCENRSGLRSARELSDDRLFEIAAELVELGCAEVALTGGEPLLRPVWQPLARQLTNAGLKVSLITNGLLLDRAMLKRCLEARIGALGISIDGLQATHDSIRLWPNDAVPSRFDRALDALRLSAESLPTIAITQINQRNLDELPALGRLLRASGITRWQVQLAIPLGRLLDLREPFVLLPKQLPALAAFLESAITAPDMPMIDVSDTIGYCTGEDALFRGKRLPDGSFTRGIWLGCSAGLRSVAITFEGKVRGCSALPPEFDAGDLRLQSLTEIWRDRSRFDFALDFSPERLTGPCEACDLGALCRGGCPTMSYYTSGTLGSNAYCLRALRRPI